MARSLFLAFLLFQAVASADKYEVFQFPQSDDNCAAAAGQVAARFQAQAKVTVQNKVGTAAGKGRCDITLTYAAHGEVYQVATHDADPLFQNADMWHFATPAECETRLADQTARFETETGLKPVVAYCADLSVSSSGRRTALIIQSFGMAKKVPYRFRLADVGKAQIYWNQAVSKSLTERGATVYWLAESKAKSREFSDTVHYYVPGSLGISRIPLERHQLNYATNEECLADLNQWKEAAKAMGATTAVAGCFPLGTNKGMQLQVVAFFPAHAMVNMVPVKDADYDGPFACRQDVARVIELYKQLYPFDFKGGFCPLKRFAKLANKHSMVLLAQ